MINHFKSILSASLIAALLCLSEPGFATVSIDSHGWTNITPSSDSRLVYVSSSEGNDNNDGSLNAPLKTLQAANSLIRDGYPDHLLLKRGDVFPAGASNELGDWKNGRSADEPLVISYYGESGARPVIKLDGIFINTNARDRNYISFIGLDFYHSYSDPASADFDGSDSVTALRFVGGGDAILIEDCRFRFTGVVVDSFESEYSEVGAYSNFSFRRNIVTDKWTHDSYIQKDHTSGIYISGVLDSYTLEENFFDHNGWNEDVANAGANMFGHNVYIQYTNVAGGIIRGNIFARGSSHGIQARSGGIIERNLSVLNAIGIRSGGQSEPTDPNVYSFPNRVTQNVVLNGRRMDPDDGSWPRTTAVWGIEGAFIHTYVEDNIVANRIHSGTNETFPTSDGASFTLTDNISYQWDPQYDEVNPSWPSPDNDLGDYYASIGGTNSSEDYFNWLRERPLRTMNWNMTAYAPINFIRAGFNKSPVSGYYDYDGGSGGGNGTPNVALGAAVTASAFQNNEWGYNPPEFLVDGDTSTEQNARWSAEFFPQHVIVDLGESYTIEEFRLYPLDARDYQYIIEVSDDGMEYMVAVNRSSNTEGATVLADAIAATDARYVKLTVTGAATYTGDWISIGEFEIYGEPSSVPLPNVAQGAAVTASAFQNNEWGYNPPEFLVDGDTSTEQNARWSAEFFPQHIIVDLGESYALEEFRLYPLDSRDYQYTIEVSDDGVDYTVAVDRSNNTEGAAVLIDMITITDARYVKLTVTGAATYTGDWVSIGEFEIYGEPSSVPLQNIAQGADAVQHTIVDLGASYTIKEFRTYPLGDSGYQYTIEVSDDGLTYTTAVELSNNPGGTSVVVDTIPTTDARYVKLTVTGVAGELINIDNFEVYGVE